jgi:hypothetical protein
MKLFFVKYSTLVLIAFTILMSISSCKKDNFTITDPGANIDPPGVYSNMTISNFKQRYYVPVIGARLPVMMNDDIIISGIINADDQSGNYYKSVTLQDETGGILLKLNGSNLYYQYPAGRRIFIKTKGLYIFDYCGTAEIGSYIDTITSTYPSVGPLNTSQMISHVIKGQWGLPIPVRTVSIAQLISASLPKPTSDTGSYVNMQSMLYRIDNVEFTTTDTVTGVTYADPLNKSSQSKHIQDCLSYKLAVRSSGYASFANVAPAKGHGTIYGIYGFYSCGSDGTQLTIRDLNDVKFTDPRCH